MGKIGESVLNTRLLLEKISALQPGDSLSYEECNNTIGRDVRNARYRHSLTSARRMALRDFGIVTICISNQGILRPMHEDVPGLGRRRAAHINRTARVGRHEQESIDYSQLSNAARIAQLTCLSILGALEQATRVRVINNVRKLVNQSLPQRLTLEETLKAFGSSSLDEAGHV
jgi:hypothetical protein